MLVPLPDSDVQERVQSLVSNFIKTGSPSAGSVTWPKYESSARATMIFNDEGDTEIDYDILSEERELISPLLKWGISGRELVNGDLSSGISVDPDAAPEPEPEPEPTPTPSPETESDDSRPGNIGKSSGGGGCDSGFSFMSTLMLAMFVVRRRNHNA